MDKNSQFRLFPLLPGELRLKIWSYALDIPRTVEITLETETVRPGPGRRHAVSFNTTTPVPSPLHACRESRLEGLNIYRPCFRTLNSPKYIYVAFNRDIIQMADNVISYLNPDEYSSVQSLELKVKDYSYFGHYHIDILIRMTALKDLWLIVDDRTRTRWDRGGEYHYVEPLTRDIEEGSILQPSWMRPRIRIIDETSGKEVADLPGGVQSLANPEG